MKGIKTIWNAKVFSLLAAILVIVLVLPASAQLADSPWPMFHHDLNYTGRSISSPKGGSSRELF